MKVLLDINVVLDLLLNRPPWAAVLSPADITARLSAPPAP
jgi:hypothetical protein